ncbi:MAG: glycoside hydrolase family 97 protein [Bacteroides sp.]|jgi:alpha-glucosidase|nr:glycoside hydrolase family 97 protein [Bacteroides sp.]MCI1681328.1 glycoside hydrolase family 97 protein [Bacteroides sp.]
MKSTHICLYLALFFCLSCQDDGNVFVESPLKKVAVNIDLSGHKIKLSVSKNGNVVLHDCSLGLIIDSINIGEHALLDGKIARRIIHEKYSMYGNHSQVLNYCQEISLPLKSMGINYKLLVRAYDDGFAIRYVIPCDKKRMINSEHTFFALPDSAECFWAKYSDSNEELHHISMFKEIPDNQPLVAPLTVRVGAYYLAFSEADCKVFPDMSWKKQADGIKANFTTNPKGWMMQAGTIITPWRLTILADDLNQLVNSDLIMNLCSAPRSDFDFSWVKPGRVLWQWWSVGSPTFKDQKQWYDAAARLTWEYYLIDDGWKNWRQPGKDQWQCLKEVIDYGKSKGVKSLVWADSKEMRTRGALRSYLEKIKNAGAKGIKIDFIPPATPEIMQWYEIALEETYKLRLLCDFHGCVKPTGLRRTWPHEMTREGVRGNEYQMLRYDRLMPLDQDEIVPFTRLLAGPADFTPVIFNEKELRGYTWAHELAQAVIYCSPLTHFADNYLNYLGNPAEDILRDIPVVWDETQVLPCSKIGQVAAFARRKGNEWWIGIANGKEPVHLTLNLNFLTKDAFATVLSDSDLIHNAFVREESIVKKGKSIKVDIQTGGGYFMRLKYLK